MVLALTAALFVAQVQSGRSVGGGRSLATCANTYYCDSFFGRSFGSDASDDIKAAAKNCDAYYCSSFFDSSFGS